MKQPDSTKFLDRQYMLSNTFELYYYSDHPTRRIAPHSHSFYEFYFFLEGNVEMTIDGRIYPITPGNIVILRPKTVHYPSYIDPDTPYRRFVLWIHKDYYQKHLAKTDAFEYLFNAPAGRRVPVLSIGLPLFNDLQNKIFTIIRESHENRFGKDAFLAISLQSLLLQLSRFIYEKENKPRPDGASLRSRICTYIDGHLCEPLSLDVLSQVFFLNKFYISHSFKESMGISVHQYILKRRLDACKNALTTDQSLENIAAHFGFSSYSSFFRYFKKEYGISPKEYRKQWMQQIKND